MGLPKNEDYSAPILDIIESKPNWLIRNGMPLILLLLIVFLFFSNFISLPTKTIFNTKIYDVTQTNSDITLTLELFMEPNKSNHFKINNEIEILHVQNNIKATISNVNYDPLLNTYLLTVKLNSNCSICDNLKKNSSIDFQIIVGEITLFKKFTNTVRWLK